MDTGNKTVNETTQRDGDADLNLLLYKSGQSIKQFFLWIGRGISRTATAFLSILLFLFRNGIWLLVGLIAGLSYGLYQLSQGSGYSSRMIVQSNFNSSKELYNTVDYMNSLIAAGQVNDLSKIFDISPAEAKQLSDFSIEPEKSEIITAQMYKEEFFEPERNKEIRLDTFWTRTINYNDFKESLTKYDYPYYSITAVTTNPTIFRKLGTGIINHINNNELLNAIKEKQAISNSDREKLLVSSINNLDTLRRAYNERLVKGEPVVPGGNQMTVVDGTPETRTPELELYDKILELQEELKKSRNRAETEKNIIGIYSPFNPVGEKISFFDSVATLGLYGLLTAMAILIFIAFYRWLVAYESSHNPKKKTPVA